jgi:hypothetical protein
MLSIGSVCVVSSEFLDLATDMIIQPSTTPSSSSPFSGWPFLKPSMLLYFQSSNLIDLRHSGAQVVFHSVLEPLFARYFKQAGTSENLRSQAAKSQ